MTSHETSHADAHRRQPALIDAGELAARLQRGDRIVVLDVRWSLAAAAAKDPASDVPVGFDEYRDGHIPGALFVDLETELAAHASPEQGRHPLPSKTDFQETVRSLGLQKDDFVVVYDDLAGMSAARAWWLLGFAGFRTAVLDGGLTAWVASGRELETGSIPRPQASGVVIDWNRKPVLKHDDVAHFAQSGSLLDARAVERYRGETEPVDPRAGHVPGAISAPTSENVNESGHFKTTEALQKRFESLLSADVPVAVYCGSGVTAAHEILALDIAGIDAALYPGSWSQWSNDESLPLETGSHKSL
ncbi:sulfurtransferase [Neomicrococcus lactis]